MSDHCVHILSFKDRMFARKGKEKRCLSCGEAVYRWLPLTDLIVSFGWIPLLFSFGSAGSDESNWVLLFAGYAIAVFGSFLLEVRFTKLKEYDHENYRKNTTRNLLLLVLILAVAAVTILFTK